MAAGWRGAGEGLLRGDLPANDLLAHVTRHRVGDLVTAGTESCVGDAHTLDSGVGKVSESRSDGMAVDVH
jgi:hypothetical protein